MEYRAAGAGGTRFARYAEELLGRKFSVNSVQRHLRDDYLEEAGVDLVDYVGPKPSDVEILDSIIGAGYRNSRNWKPSIRDTLDAMKLKAQMTGNSAFDDLIKLFDVDDDTTEDPEEEEVAPETPEAMASDDERAEAGFEEEEEESGSPGIYA